MTTEEQKELQSIRAAQTQLRLQLSQVDQRLAALESAAVADLVSPVAQPRALEVVQQPVIAAPAFAPAPTAASRERSTVPPELPRAAASTARQTPEGLVAGEGRGTSIEMQIGTTWLVRTGIVLLLTSLAFAGNYLYQNVVPHLGPASKVALLYLAAGSLAGLGAWLERSRQARESEGLLNYARVLLAGGLAAVYYVTYAAHYLPNLRVIESAVVAGILLLAWTAFMVWLADRRNSEVLATFAILLAYYTAAINEIESFTLWSNLALSAGGVYLLRRHLWRFFPVATLLASYGSYVFWCVVHHGAGPNPTPEPWPRYVFLSIYWLLFTGATLAPAIPGGDVHRRARFAGLNNSTYFLLITWLLLPDHPFWRWASIFGLVLLSIGEIGSRNRVPLDSPIARVYQGQGILLLVWASIDYFSSWHLSLLLAVETVVLVIVSRRSASPLLAWLAAGCALLSLVGAWNEVGLSTFDGQHPWLALASIGIFFLAAAWLCQRDRESLTAANVSSAPVRAWNDWIDLAVAPAYFSFLAAALWIVLLENRITLDWARSPWLAVAALTFFGIGQWLRIRAMQWYALGYLLLAQSHWLLRDSPLSRTHGFVELPPLWNIGVLLGATIIFGVFWKAAGRSVLPPGAIAAPSTSQMRSAFYVLCLAAGCLCGWIYISNWHLSAGMGAFTLAARWSLYAAAVFTLGLLIHERVYRWLGLLILLATLGQIILFDVWSLGLLERALSFLSLGIVLLAVGFLYNRFSAKFRDIL